MTAVEPTPSLLDLLTEAASRFREGDAVREAPGAAVSLGELLERATALRNAFRGSGMESGDQVLFAVRPGIDQLSLALAICDAGGVLVACDPRVPNAILAARLERLTPNWIVAESFLLALTARRWPSRLLGPVAARLAPLGAVPGVRRVRVGPWLPGLPDARSLRDFIARAAPARPAPDVDPSLPALIEFTSGTTAAPKGVVHTRRSLLATIDATRATLDAGPGDIVLSGALHLIVPALLLGARVVIPRRDNEGPARTMRRLEHGGVTHFFTVTSACRALVDYCVEQERRLPDSIRLLMIGGAPVHPPFLGRLRDVLPPRTRVVCVYGMTEMLPVASASLEEKLAWTGPGDLLGRTVPGACARIAPTGELVLAGPALFDRYLGGEPVTELATGDFARFDEGRLVLLGRARDMIIRGAFNIYPELYEPIIEGIPGVRRCALVGLYDEGRADECVVLAVEPETSTDARSLMRRLPDALRTGPFRIDPSAMPDHIVTMPLPESGRSSKVDKVALRGLVKDRVSCA